MKPALAAMRTVDVLNYLTVNPRNVFTLSEISTALGVSLASMSAVLLALSEAGYVIRHPRHKTFEIGPALVATGHAASIRHPIVELARPHMPALAAMASECVGSALVGDDIIILAIDGAPAPNIRELRVGQRLPLLPPYGQAFLAWSPPGTIRRWLRLPGEGEFAALYPAFERSLHAVRSRGFAVGLENDQVTEVQALIDQAARHPRDEVIQAALRKSIPRQSADYAVDEIDIDRDYRLHNIAAPVFGADGSVVYVLTVQGFGVVTGEHLLRSGETLSDICRTLTRELGGRAPDDREFESRH